MDGNKSVTNSTGIYGIGSWMKKKRYEDDDICISPPSDESGFLSLNFGVQQPPKPQPSTFDRINKELGFCTEDSTATSSSITFSGTESLGTSLMHGSNVSGIESQTTSLMYGSGGTFLRDNASTSFLNPSESMTAGTKEVSDHEMEESSESTENIETLVCKTHQSSRHRKVFKQIEDPAESKIFLENLQNLSMMYTDKTAGSVKVKDKGKSSIPPLDSPSEPPSEAVERRRRRSSVPSDLHKLAIEDSIKNSFFTGGLFSSISNSTSTISKLGISDFFSSIGTSPPVVTVSVPNVSQLETTSSDRQNLIKQAFHINSSMKPDGSHLETQVLQTKVLKRRPKASPLREMNIWSPQSM